MNIENKINKNVQLAPLTSFKIGGPAEFFIEVKTNEELQSAVVWADRKSKKVTILGGGSNVLINDQGISGLVIKMDIKGIKRAGDILIVGAGEKFSNLVANAYNYGFIGLEWATGIPGTVGGAIRGNAGAFGSSISENIKSIEIFDLTKTKFIKLTEKNCAFGYRDSVFKNNTNLIIANATLNFKKGKKNEIKKEMTAVVKQRSAKHPLAPSAGSIFKNLKAKKLEKDNFILYRQAQKEQIIKKGMVPAGWLIEKLDPEIKTVGGASLSDMHANIIVNKSQATAADVATLIAIIKTKIRNKFHIKLQEEIKYLGF